MIGIFFALAIFAALGAMGLRRFRRKHLQKAAASRPGGRADNAIYIRSFDEMDEHLRRRWCSCGGFPEPAGEGTRELEGRRFRVARLTCQECEETSEVFFDTTDLLQ